MDIIDEEDFNKAEPEADREIEEMPMFSKDDFDALKHQFDKPLEEMKGIAVKLKIFLNYKMKKEMDEKKFLSDHTLRWVREYNELLDRIQKGMYGERSVNIHLGKVTHSHIASMMREYSSVPQSKERKEKKEKKEKEIVIESEEEEY